MGGEHRLSKYENNPNFGALPLRPPFGWGSAPGASFQIFLGRGRDGLTNEASLVSRGFVGGVRGGCKPPSRKFFYFELFYVLFEAT